MLINMLLQEISGGIKQRDRRQIVLSFDNGAEKFPLPVTPKEFQIDDGQGNKTMNITEAGEINLIGYRNLKALTLVGFFPRQLYPYVVSDELKDPYEYIDILRRWKESKKPIRVLITATDINLAMAIESIQYGEKDGSGDVYYSLNLKEYRFLNIPSANNDKQVDSTTGLKERPVEKKVPDAELAKVKQSQDILDVAKKTYGDIEKWRRIAENNDLKDLASLKPGDLIMVALR